MERNKRFSTPVKKTIDAQGKVCKTVDFTNDETLKKRGDEISKKRIDDNNVVEIPDLFFEIVRFWTKQLLQPDDLLAAWGEKDFELNFGESSLFNLFCFFYNKQLGTRILNVENTTISKTRSEVITPCHPRQFLDLCKLLLPGFKKVGPTIIIPSKFQVQMRLRQFTSEVSQITFPLQECLFQHSSTPLFFRPLHLVITPGFYKSSENKNYSTIAYYNITQHGQLVQTSQIEQARICDMMTVHPMFHSNLWSHFLFLIGSLAQLNDLFIYFRYDTGQFYQYVIVHDQAFDIDHVEEQSTIDHAPRFCMRMQTTLEEQDVDIGTTPSWICDVDAADIAGPESEPTISSSFPNYRGLKIRFIFRQNYSQWFF